MKRAAPSTGEEQAPPKRHQPPSDYDLLRGVLNSTRVPRVDPNDAKAFHEALDKFGAVFVPLADEDFDWIGMRRAMGARLAATFPDVGERVRTSLQQGNMAPFNKLWKKGKVADHKILLHSYGMPVGVPLERPEMYRDPVVGSIFRYSPVAAAAGLEFHRRLGTKLVPKGAAVPDDGIKTKAGSKATPLHYDGYQGEHEIDEKAEPVRVQMILVDDEDAMRRLALIPNTEQIANLIARITGTTAVRQRGFRTLKLDEHPRLKMILHAFAQTLERGIIAFKAGTFHMEVHNPLWEGEDRTFRVYCGYITNIHSVVSKRDLIRMAFLRLNDRSFDHFSIKANRRNPMFVNDKTTQYRAVKVEGIDRDMRRMMGWEMQAMVADIRKKLEGREKDLELMGLTQEDLQEFC